MGAMGFDGQDKHNPYDGDLKLNIGGLILLLSLSALKFGTEYYKSINKEQNQNEQLNQPSQIEQIMEDPFKGLYSIDSTIKQY